MRPVSGLASFCALLLLLSAVAGTASPGVDREVGPRVTDGTEAGDEFATDANGQAGFGGFVTEGSEADDVLVTPDHGTSFGAFVTDDPPVANATVDVSGEGSLPSRISDVARIDLGNGDRVVSIPESAVRIGGSVDATDAGTGSPDPGGTGERGTDPGDRDGNGTETGASDADDDGLVDGRELAIGTDPTRRDTDGDRLGDGRELAIGTDPTRRDTDGDALLDGWEYYDRTGDGARLPGSDPLSKDVYVQLDYARGVDGHDERFARRVAAAFEEMPVENPDNSTGIDVHVRRGRINGTVTFTGENFWALKERHYAERLGPRAGVYHHVVVAHFVTEGVGYGEVGGEFAVVARSPGNTTQRNAVVHELLHNVVGHVHAPGACRDDPTHYCGDGWLSPHITHPDDEFLPRPVAAQLERDGFVE